jgi:hypothetical protein
MDLPKNEKSFYFRHVGELTGRVYEGDFVTKCVLNLSDKRFLEVEKSSLTLDLSNPSGNLSAIGNVVANLRVRIIDAPDWFVQLISSLDVLDDELFFEIYSKCLELSDQWITELKGKAAKDDESLKRDSEGNSQKES